MDTVLLTLIAINPHPKSLNPQELCVQLKLRFFECWTHFIKFFFLKVIAYLKSWFWIWNFYLIGRKRILNGLKNLLFWVLLHLILNLSWKTRFQRTRNMLNVFFLIWGSNPIRIKWTGVHLITYKRLDYIGHIWI